MFTKTRKQTSCFRRICDVVCTILLMFYVLFDVIDLDGSTVCRLLTDLHHPTSSSAIESDSRSDDLPESNSARLAPLALQALIRPTQPSQTTRLLTPLSPSARFHSDRGCRSDTNALDAPPDH